MVEPPNVIKEFRNGATVKSRLSKTRSNLTSHTIAARKNYIDAVGDLMD